MSPLQLSVYWRLSLLFFFAPFLFFLDTFTAAVSARTCRHDNATEASASWFGTFPPRVDRNQSQPGEVWEASADWRTEKWQQHSVCGWTDWLAHGQTVFMVGLLLGSMVGGAISDRYGKRPVLLLCACIQAFCGLVPAVFPQPLLFLTLRCVTAVCCCCIHICAFSLAVEWTLPAARLWPPAFLPFCFSLGTMGGAPLAWLSPTWTYLHLSLALPQFICLPLYLSIPESPRWLWLQRRKDVLEGYRSNSPADRKCLDLLLDSASCDMQKAAEAGSGGHAPSDITNLRHPTILLRLFIMSYLSAATALTYYGICLNIGSFGVGVYAAQFFSGLSEAPCLLVPLIRVGRRLICMLALFLSGTACLISLLLSRYDGTPALVMSLALLGKLCILAATFISVLYCIELFPTVVRYGTFQLIQTKHTFWDANSCRFPSRQRCISLVNLSYRLGCLVTTVVPPGPTGAISLAAMVVYSSGPIIGCGLCLLLPETSGIPLPDSLEDCNRQPKRQPDGMDTFWRPREPVSSQPRTAEIVISEKVDVQTPDTPFL